MPEVRIVYGRELIIQRVGKDDEFGKGKAFFKFQLPLYILILLGGVTVKVSLMVAGAQGGGYALGIWMPTYLRTVRGLSAPSAGGYLLVQILGALVGFLLGKHGGHIFHNLGIGIQRGVGRTVGVLPLP